MVDDDTVVPLLGSRAIQAMNLVQVQYQNILAMDSIVKEVVACPVTETDGTCTMEHIKREYFEVCLHRRWMPGRKLQNRD